MQGVGESAFRVRTALRILTCGTLIPFFDAIMGWVNNQPYRSVIGLVCGCSLFSFIFVLQKSRSIDLAFGLASCVGVACCFVHFLLNGDALFLALGMVVAIAMTMFVKMAICLKIGSIFGVAALFTSIAIDQHWYAPPLESSLGLVHETVLILLIMVTIGISSMLRERAIKVSDARRRLSEIALQKQLAGLQILAETTMELVTIEPNETHWMKLLGRVASHLDCELFTDHEVQSDKLCLKASAGLPASAIERIGSISFGEGVFGVCAETQKLIYLYDQEVKEFPQGAELIRLGIHVVAVVPLIFGEKLVGILSFASSTKSSFAREELHYLTTLGQAVASVRGRAIADALTRASERRFRALVDCTSHHFYLIDREARFVDVNHQACFALGYNREELLQLRVPDIVVGITDDDVKAIRASLLEQDVFFENSRHRRKDGTDFPVEVHLSRISLDGADFTVALAHDVSNRKQRSERMIQSQKMEAIGRLAGGVAHDFNNLLCVINSYSEILMEDMTLAETQRAWMRAIYDAGQRGAGLTRQLLVFGRKAVFDPKAMDLNEVVFGAKQLLSRLIGENIALEANLSSSECGIWADRSQIDQVLINLSVNARDSMLRGGTLTLQTKKLKAGEVPQHLRGTEAEFVQLIVSDTGKGINPELLPKIFDPFFTTKGVGEGTGLGLAVVYGIVNESGGWIEVLSELGKGSSFIITLPAYNISEAGSDPPIASQFGKANAIILLVEDDISVREVTSFLLRQQGYAVLEAESPRHAIELAKQNAETIRVLLTDVVMPEMNGPEIVREIRTFLPKIPVIYMSGYSYDAIAEITDLGDYFGLLNKPFSFRELSMRLNEVVSTTKLAAFTQR